MAAEIILLRHARPLVGHGHPSEWGLSPQGRQAAWAVAKLEFWRSVAYIYSSPERKAIQTAVPISARHRIPVYMMEGLREVKRPYEDEDFEAKLEAYFSGEPPPGWENPDEAEARIRTCIVGLSARLEGRVAVVSHGAILTLFVANIQGAKPTYERHKSIGFCDYAIYDPESGAMVKDFGGEGYPE
ncbi:MAG: histidine phosphatase family protein [Thermoplasmata archaeon]